MAVEKSRRRENETDRRTSRPLARRDRYSVAAENPRQTAASVPQTYHCRSKQRAANVPHQINNAAATAGLSFHMVPPITTEIIISLLLSPTQCNARNKACHSGESRSKTLRESRNLDFIRQIFPLRIYRFNQV